jgi:hypothetical protein
MDSPAGDSHPGRVRGLHLGGRGPPRRGCRRRAGPAPAVTLLHYAALNPLSAPFWHRSGYRPLSTRWKLTLAR